MLRWRKADNKIIVLYIFSTSRKHVGWDREATEKLNAQLPRGDSVTFINCDRTFLASDIKRFCYPQGFEGYVSPQAFEIIKRWARERGSRIQQV